MGSAGSALVTEVRPSWECEHSLGIDRGLRDVQLDEVSKFQKSLRMYSVLRRIHGFEYFHFFISDGVRVLEFGSGESSGGTLRITVEAQRQGQILEKAFENSEEVRSRMKQVCGATSYSLSLRNSEHLCRYVQSGTWYSLQMTGKGPLNRALRKGMGEKAASVSTPPAELEPRGPGLASPVYPAWTSRFSPVFRQTRRVLTYEDSGDINIVVLGPTGAGKSTIINLLFNQTVAKVKASARSVTKQMHIYTGDFVPEGGSERRTVNVIDSVGFCDSVLPPSDVAQLVKDFIKSSVLQVHKVMVVCAGRIENEQACAIKNFMEWLDYPKHKPEFIFIYNKCECLSPAQKTECLGEMCDLLGADTNYGTLWEVAGEQIRVSYTISTAFPSRFPLEEVKEDLLSLYNATFLIRDDIRVMQVETSSCAIL